MSVSISIDPAVNNSRFAEKVLRLMVFLWLQTQRLNIYLHTTITIWIFSEVLISAIQMENFFQSQRCSGYRAKRSVETITWKTTRKEEFLIFNGSIIDFFWQTTLCWPPCLSWIHKYISGDPMWGIQVHCNEQYMDAARVWCWASLTDRERHNQSTS